MTSQNPDHGTVYIPCVPLGRITVTRYDSTLTGTIASVDFSAVAMHVETPAGARELLHAAVETMRILDPAGLAAFYQQILSERIIELLAEDEEEPEVVMYGGVPLDVAQPEDIPVALVPVHECSACGIADPVRVGEHGRCWNSQRCAARVAEKAAAR